MQSEEVSVLVRTASNHLVAALYAIPRLPAPPSIYAEKDHRYIEIKYRVPNSPVRRTIHVGRSTDEERHLLNQQIDAHWSRPRRSMFKRYRGQISAQNTERTNTRLEARQLAEDLGYYFHGRVLCRRHGPKTTIPASEHHSKLEQLEQSLQNLQTITADLHGVYCCELTTWQFCRRPWCTSGPLMSKRERRGWATVKGLGKDLKALAVAVKKVRKERNRLENTHENTGD